VFANAKNGLDIPFGMAFTEDSFFLGNHNQLRRYSYQNGQETLTGTGEKLLIYQGVAIGNIGPEM